MRMIESDWLITGVLVIIISFAILGFVIFEFLTKRKVRPRIDKKNACNFCGAVLQPQVSSCYVCGEDKDMENIKKKIVCPNCGASVERGAHVCNVCNEKFWSPVYIPIEVKK
ncbi:MAG: zinc ribbon domain-containing protein [Candidatus Thermoplasmatota archaeon]